MLPLMALMIGAYIITRMMIFLLGDDPNQSKFSLVVNKLLASGTIIITIVCLILIWISSVGLDMEQFIK